MACFLAVLTTQAAHGQPNADPEAYDLNFSKGLVAFENGQYVQAETLLRRALAARPGDEDASFYLGQTLLKLRRQADAETVFRDMLTRNPDSGHGLLGLGMLEYSRERYDDALVHLTAAQRVLPDEALVHFYLGLVHHAREDFDKSPARFMRAMSLSRDLAPSAHYYAGLAFFKRGVLDEAREAFQDVLHSADPNSEMVRSARALLADIEAASAKQPKRWDIFGSANLQYDTNVVLLPLGTQPPGGPTGISQKSDVRHSLLLRGEYRPIQTDTWIAAGAYNVYQSFHMTLRNFDVEDHTPSVYVQRQFGPVQVRAQYAFDYVKVGQAPYLIAHSGQGFMTIPEGGQAYIQLQARYQNKDFQNGLFPQNTLRDGKNYMVGVTQYFLFASNAGSVRVGYAHDRDLTGGGSPSAATPGVPSAADWAYHGHLFSTGVSLPPIHTIKLDASFDYYLQHYRNPSSFSTDGTVARRDNIYFASATASRDLTEHLGLSLQYSYTRDQNNLRVFDYTRSVFSIQLIGRF